MYHTFTQLLNDVANSLETFMLAVRTWCWPSIFFLARVPVKPQGKVEPSRNQICHARFAAVSMTCHHDATGLSLGRLQGTPSIIYAPVMTERWRSAALENHHLRAVFHHPNGDANANARRNTILVLSAGTFHGSAPCSELRGRHTVWTASLLRFYNMITAAAWTGSGIARLHSKGNAHASCTYQVLYILCKYLNLKWLEYLRVQKCIMVALTQPYPHHPTTKAVHHTKLFVIPKKQESRKGHQYNCLPFIS
jgi:hypothetical protein